MINRVLDALIVGSAKFGTPCVRMQLEYERELDRVPELPRELHRSWYRPTRHSRSPTSTG